MSVIVRVDSRGRITIPKKLRVKLNIEEGTLLEALHEENKIILKPLKSIAEQYYGKYKIEEWPKDLDKFVVEAASKWWKKGSI